MEISLIKYQLIVKSKVVIITTKQARYDAHILIIETIIVELEKEMSSLLEQICFTIFL